MGNFQEKLARFMRGRYGVDQLYYALIALAFALLFVNLFLHSPFVEILMWIIIVWTIYRAFSRNTYRRQRENQRFLKLWNPLRKQGSLTMRRIREINTHRYRRCPYCQKILRLPRRRGTHGVTCPACHQEFKVHIPW
ncbi:MAG: hypothetical protein ACOX6F_06295 [Syntrophomonadaceae bacterium]|jgi:ssDNA-binding Zn-finger/Zn-ribbon topoisomerase 1|nr:hypothetical protein [Bacillota bacterium]HOQ10422.1 hypothetical protein [Syntrophomonadaceae bacterium]HPU49553.1 hypothetical protein [Syntrophomonadaceae bacterium]HQA08046.1 hypothetical protein [Syntrophomonadaceae bacterium]